MNKKYILLVLIVILTIFSYVIIDKKEDNYISENKLLNISFNGIKIRDKPSKKMLKTLVMDAEFKYSYNDINFNIDKSDKINYLSFHRTEDINGKAIKDINDIKIMYNKSRIYNIDDFKKYLGEGKTIIKNEYKSIKYIENDLELVITIKDKNIVNLKLQNK